MPLATGARDAAQLQRRLWSPRILRPTIWLDAYRVLPNATWPNRGSLADGTFSGDPAVYDANGAANVTRGKPSVTWAGGASGTVTISGAPTSSFVTIFVPASPANNIVLGVGGSTQSGADFGSYPRSGLHLWNWPNATLTVNVSRVAWLNGTLLPASSVGTTGSSGGAGAVIFCGSTNGTGGGGLGRLLGFNTPNTYIDNISSLARQGDNSFNELITVDRQLTTHEQQQVEGYLAWKWGYVSRLPASHRYKSRPPEIGA